MWVGGAGGVKDVVATGAAVVVRCTTWWTTLCLRAGLVVVELLDVVLEVVAGVVLAAVEPLELEPPQPAAIRAVAAKAGSQSHEWGGEVICFASLSVALM